MGSALSRPAPLNLHKSQDLSNLAAVGIRDVNCYVEKSPFVEEVTLARNEVYLAKTSCLMLDLSNTDISLRSHHHKQIHKSQLA
jgi:hypothetical protein